MCSEFMSKANSDVIANVASVIAGNFGTSTCIAGGNTTPPGQAARVCNPRDDCYVQFLPNGSRLSNWPKPRRTVFGVNLG